MCGREVRATIPGEGVEAVCGRERGTCGGGGPSLQWVCQVVCLGEGWVTSPVHPGEKYEPSPCHTFHVPIAQPAGMGHSHLCHTCCTIHTPPLRPGGAARGPTLNSLILVSA